MSQCARHVRCRRYAMPPPSGGALHGVSHGSRRAEGGASLTEFAIVAPVLLFMGLGTVQAGLLYHGKTILNYATFEAARAGATRHAQPEPMRRELTARLAPLYGGDGSEGKAAVAIGRALAESASPLTRLEIVNPTPASFAAWGRESVEWAGQRGIPNAHLRHQPDEGKGAGGQTLRDANLLKIEVTIGYEPKVPLVGPLLARLVGVADDRAEHAAYYPGNDPGELAFAGEVVRYQPNRLKIARDAAERGIGVDTRKRVGVEARAGEEFLTIAVEGEADERCVAQVQFAELETPVTLGSDAGAALHADRRSPEGRAGDRVDDAAVEHDRSGSVFGGFAAAVARRAVAAGEDQSE